MIKIYDNLSGIIDRMDREKPTMIILHYTVISFQDTVKEFSNNIPKNGILAHYLISKAGASEIDRSPMRFATDYSIVSHAGISCFNSLEYENRYSIGIENDNKGFTDTDEGGGVKINGSDKYFYNFPDSQVSAIIALCTDLINKYNISPFYITGHADVAVPNGRKPDPGPLFPWKLLAEHGIGLWYNLKLTYPSKNFDKIDKYVFIDKLVEYGYPTPQYIYDGTKIVTTNDPKIIEFNSNRLLEIYNMHFRQEKGISTDVDDQDFQIIDCLIHLKNVTLKNKNLNINWKELYNTTDKDYLQKINLTL